MSSEITPTPAPESESLFFADMISHNQNEWRSRKKGPLTLTSPIEIRPSRWLLGEDTISRIFSKFGDVIHPEYHKSPLLIGVSAFADTTYLTRKMNFYYSLDKISGVEIFSFTEANTRWLTSVAMGKNPVKELAKADSIIFKLSEPSKSLLASALEGNVEQVTKAIASFHFLGLTDKINTLLSDNKQIPIPSIEDWLKQNDNRDEHLSKIGISLDFGKLNDWPEWRVQLFLSITAAKLHFLSFIGIAGFSSLPGIISLFPFPPFPKIPLFLSEVATHEAIHSYGHNPTHNQGIPTRYGKLSL